MSVKRVIPLLMLVLLAVSCGTQRLTFDRTERSFRELGGKYDAEVEVLVVKTYKNGDINDVIELVYSPDYQGGDPYIDVEGYLGDAALDEFKKRVKDLKTEIEDLRKGVRLLGDKGGNEGLSVAVLNEIYPLNLVIEALGGEEKKNTQDFLAILQEKTQLRDELRLILDETGVEGIKEALKAEAYAEEDIETYLGKSTLADAKLLWARETGTDGFVPVGKTTLPLEMDGKPAGDTDEDDSLPLIRTVVIITLVLLAAYILAAVIRSVMRRALPASVSILFAVVVSAAPIGVCTFLLGWSIWWLLYLLSLPSALILAVRS